MSAHSVATVAAWLDRILDHEGAYSSDPDDPGNWTRGARGQGILKGTKWGISAAAYPHLAIVTLSKDDAAAIYLEDYLAPLRADRYADGVAFQLLDFAVNSGIRAATRALQRAVSVKDDGVIGPITLAAIATYTEAQLVMLILAQRLFFLTKLDAFEHYGRGWTRRCAENLRYGAQDVD